MLIYYIFIFYLLFACMFKRKDGTYSVGLRFFALAFMFVIFAFRDVSVGADTSTYESLYNSQYGWHEVGYVYIVNLANKLGITFRGFLMLVSAFSVVSVGHFIKKYSEDYMFSLLMFVTVGLFTMYMTGIRQVISISILLWSFDFIIKKKWYLFFPSVVLAALFHTSAWVFLPVYFIRWFKFSRKKIVAICIIGLIVTLLFKDNLWGVIAPYVPKQYDDFQFNAKDYSTNILVVLVDIFILGFSLLYYKKTEVNRDYIDIMIMFQVIIIILQVFGYSAMQIARLAYYFSGAKLVIIPASIGNISKRNDKLIIVMAIVVLTILKFAISIPGAYSQIDNYQFYF